MIEANVPAFLKPLNCDNLIRVGRDHDGGYVVPKNDIDSTDILVGLGINNDWSFESHFVKLKDVPIVAYDASVSKKIFLNTFLMALLKPHRPKLLASRVWTYFSYLNFFKGDRTHIEKFVGPSKDQSYVSMESVFESIPQGNVFLKIDIEGDEYGLLKEIVNYQNRLSGLVIEFHDSDVHLREIQKFVDDFDLILVHIHANNFAPLNINKLPLVLELTFSKTPKLVKTQFQFPREIDMPNNRFSEEIKITF